MLSVNVLSECLSVRQSSVVEEDGTCSFIASVSCSVQITTAFVLNTLASSSRSQEITGFKVLGLIFLLKCVVVSRV
ncbi:unnamed protein product [Cylicocyclus nassatus]|uniref:Uncharacterized protein n=1 Tax=Cylicocyclus nassatus TaxID=53992 RepID=A0AA36DLP5_CYLNA|nr:unnamed protein product [Cylicocyclus nassatus]